MVVSTWMEMAYRTKAEHFHDSQSSSGFLAWHLKTLQQKTSSRKTDTQATEQRGGPANERDVSHLNNQLREGSCMEAIALMNHSRDRKLIIQKMKETFDYRQHLVHDAEKSSSVLAVFPQLLDTKGLILQDFAMLFGPDTAARLLEKWCTCFKERVIKEAGTLSPTSFLQRLIASAENKVSGLDKSTEGDSDLSSILLLLHLLSPQPSGRKRTQKISVREAVGHLVKFHKSGRSLDEQLTEIEGQH